MLINILVLLVLLVAAYAIAKVEKESFHKWLSNDPTFWKEDWVKFWLAVTSKPSRAAALAVAVVCQSGWVSMLATIAVALILTCCMAKSGLLDIDWFQPRNIERANMVCYGLAIANFINAFGLFNIIWTIIEIVALIVIVIVIVSVIQRSKSGGDDADGDGYYEEDDDDDANPGHDFEDDDDDLF